MLVQLKRLAGYDDLVPLHRIDRDTAGLVLLGKRPADCAAYHALSRQQHIRSSSYPSREGRSSFWRHGETLGKGLQGN